LNFRVPQIALAVEGLNREAMARFSAQEQSARGRRGSRNFHATGMLRKRLNLQTGRADAGERAVIFKKEMKVIGCF